MMMTIKAVVFVLIVITVKFIFIYVNDIGDQKIQYMRELIDFTEYLRIYSCKMQMSLEEIMLKYNFRSVSTAKVCSEFSKQINSRYKEKYNQNEYVEFIGQTLGTTNEFNRDFAEIVDYYGNTFSDVLDKKLDFSKEEMERKLTEFSVTHKEKKLLFNKISVLAGCLTAIILI